MKLAGIMQEPNCEYPVDYTLTIEQDEGAIKDFSELAEGSLPDPNIYTIYSKSTNTAYWYTSEELYKFTKFNCYLNGRLRVPEVIIDALQNRGDITLPTLESSNDWYEFRDLGTVYELMPQE